MLKRILAVVVLAVAVPAPAMAAGPFLEYGKAAAGIVIIGGIACAATRALLNSGLAICTPSQRQQGVPFNAQQHGHLLTSTVRERLVVIERTTPNALPNCSTVPVGSICRKDGVETVGAATLPDCSTVAGNTPCQGKQYKPTRTTAKPPSTPTCPRAVPEFTEFDAEARPIHTRWKCYPA